MRNGGHAGVLKELIECTEAGLFVIGASGRLTFLNSAFAELLGYEREQLLDAPATEIFPEGHLEAVEEQVREFVAANSGQLTRKLVLEQRDGSCLTVAVRLTLKEGEDGSYEGIMGAARGVNAHENRASELERYETIVQAVGDPVCTLDESGQFWYVNDSFETTTGYGSERVRDETLDLLFDSEDADAVRTAITEVAGTVTEAVTTVEATIRTKDDEAVPVECRITTLPTASDDPQAVVAVLHDVTRLKRRERRLSKFASVVSHDLRNPMDVALGRAEVLPEIADLDPETEQHLDDIYASVKRMERIIQDVLTLTRDGGDSVETETVSLAAVAEDTWDNVVTEAATLTVGELRPIEAHRGRLEQLLENLFRNAIQHGGRGVTVRVEPVRESGEPVGFRVADDGTGVPEEYEAQIFDEGFTTTPEGTGLGLVIVADVADAHGWEIDVREGSDGGAAFEITGVSYQ